MRLVNIFSRFVCADDLWLCEDKNKLIRINEGFKMYNNVIFFKFYLPSLILWCVKMLLANEYQRYNQVQWLFTKTIYWVEYNKNINFYKKNFYSNSL